MNWTQVIDHLAHAFKPHGFDVVQPFRVADYNAAVPERFRLDVMTETAPLGVLIGNTAALWQPFLRWLKAAPERLELPDPLDQYTERMAANVLSQQPFAAQIRFSHDQTLRPFAAQKLAMLAGLAWQSPASLSVHPAFGPWLSFRMAWVVDLPGPEIPAVPATDPCGHCAQACLPALQQVLEKVTQHQANSGADAVIGTSMISAFWQDWIAVRDACPVGHQHRFGAQQLGYHYLRDKAILRQAMEAL